MTIDTNAIAGQLEEIRVRAEELESRFEPELAAVHPAYRASARNLLHYIALRQFDLRELQRQLAAVGLSSLGRSEQHVLASLDAVHHALSVVSGAADDGPDDQEEAFRQARQRSDDHARDLLGPSTERRSSRIMVTLPSEAASDAQLVEDLIMTGTDIVRINCAHDGQVEWLAMVDNVRRANETLARECRIVMDLAGPKHRTGLLMPGPRVLRLRPRRDALGRVISARRVRLVPDDGSWSGHKFAVVPVARECIDQAHAGDEIRFTDTRGKKRKMHVVAKDEDGLILELLRPAYLATGTRLRLINRRTGKESKFVAGDLPPVEQPIVLRIDDELILENSNDPGEPAHIASGGEVLRPARVSCAPEEIFDQVAAGDPVKLNDGKIEGVVERATRERLHVRITRAKPAGSRLRGDRGVNFPKSDLKGMGLTERDREALAFATRHADAVGLSFVREPADVVALQQELSRYPDCELGIIPKIETERAFADLPRIILAAMRNYPAGIMIARGDLAVECGWVRLAEIQEEMLWLCEAAQIPVIWATQVLEGEAKKGIPTRAEITDAAMSQRADCVMLNKGPHILSAISMLDDILRRMQRHQYKKSARLGRLKLSDFQ